ncbi:hypothetical protein [Bowdeniella nasicola]|uniref:hypothetical protein n=1 Tax=Bowdeniella nasicola TaxID=208480 RepID=UPI0011614C34|nr:hypothetical protein [Bowdeniella nasicola]
MKKFLAAIVGALLAFVPAAVHAKEIDPAGPIHCAPMSVAPLAQTSSSSRPDAELQCGTSRIPVRLLVGGKVNLKVFTVKIKNGWREPKGQGWWIERDRAGHAEKYWKLKKPHNQGKVVASLYPDGRIFTGKMRPEVR